MDPLAALRDIHLPAEPGWWPPAPGWWLLALLLAALVAASARPARRWLGRRRRRRWLRAQLQALHGTATRDAAAGLAALSSLLRRVALTRHPRARVAALHGPAWLAFLDETGGDGRFSEGAARVLAVAPYAAPGAQPADLDAVFDAARRWLERNA